MVRPALQAAAPLLVVALFGLLVWKLFTGHSHA